MKQLWQWLVDNNLTTETWEQFQQKYSSTNGSAALHSWMGENNLLGEADVDLNSFRQKFGFDVPEEEVKEERVVSQEESIINANTEKHRDWWADNSDLGAFENYSQNADGNWVDSTGRVVLYKQVLDENTVVEEGEMSNMLPVGDGRMFVWRGLASSNRSRELAEQLETQNNEIQAPLMQIKANEDMDSDPIKSRGRENYRTAAKFSMDPANKDIDLSAWEYRHPNEIVGAQGTRNAGKVINASNLPDGDERYLEVIAILKEEAEVAELEDKRAKAVGKENVAEITNELLSSRENVALRNILDTNLLDMGFNIGDKGFEWGYGNLTIESKDGEKFISPSTGEEGILTGGGAKEVDIMALNLWIKNNAYDMGSALDAAVSRTGVTDKQSKRNKKEAAGETHELLMNMANRKIEDRSKQDEMVKKMLDDAVIQLSRSGQLQDESGNPVSFNSFDEYNESVGGRFEDIGPPGDGSTTGRLARRWETKQQIVDWVSDMIMEGAYPEARDLGFGVDNTVELAYTKGTNKIKVFSGTVNVQTGYAANDAYIEENGDKVELFNAATHKEAKRQLINAINESRYQKRVDELVDEGLTRDEAEAQASEEDLDLSREAVQSIMDADTWGDGSYGMIQQRGLPQALQDEMWDAKIHYDEIWQGISVDNANVRNDVESELVRRKNGADIQDNIHRDVKEKSGRYWTDEKFKDELEESASKRWEELKEKDKVLVARSEELNGYLRSNGDLLNEALKDLRSLKFTVGDESDLSAQEAIDKIANTEYTNAEERDAAIIRGKEIVDIYNAANNKVQTYLDANKTYLDLTLDLRKDLNELNLDIEDLSWYKEAIDDRQALGFLMADAFVNATIELGQGFIEIGGFVADVGVEVYGWLWSQLGRPFGVDAKETKEEIDEWYAETVFGDRTAQKWIDEFQEEGVMRYGVGALLEGEYGKSYDVVAPKAIEDCESFSDYGEWAALALANQAPQLLLMFATSGVASIATRSAMAANTLSAAARASFIQNFSLGTMGVQSFGSTYKDLREQDILYKESGGLYGHKYSLLQMASVAAISGTAEALSEKITFGLMKGSGSSMMGAFSSTTRRNFLKNQAEFGFGTAVRRQLFGETRKDFFQTMGRHSLDFIEESGSEGIATLTSNLAQRYVGGREDIHVWDGVLESVATGALLAGAIKTPAFASHVMSPFKSFDTTQKLAQLNAVEDAEMDRLNRILQQEDADPEVIKDIRNKLAEIEKTKAELIEIDIKRVDLLDDAEKKVLIDADKAMRNLAVKYRTESANKELSQEELAKRLAAIEAEYEIEAKKKAEIIEKYPPNVVEQKYEAYTNSVRRRMASFTKLTGVENRLLEGTTSDFKTYLEGKYDQQFDEALANEQAILESEDSTEEQKAVAQRNIDNISRFKAEQSKEGSREYGVMAPIIEDGKLVRYEMFVNKETSVTDGKFNTASHEFLHTLLHNTIHSDPVVRGVLGQNLMELALSDKAKWKSPEAKAKWLQTVMSYESSAIGEEVLTNLSQAIQDGDVSFDADTYGGRIKEGFNRLLQRTGWARDIEFNTADDVRQFVVNYSKSIKGNYTNRTLQRSAAKGITGKLTLDVGGQTISLAEAQTKAAKMRSEINFSKAIDAAIEKNPDLMRSFDKFVKTEDGSRKYSSLEEFRRSPDFVEAALEILEGRMLDGLMQQGMTELGLPGNALREFTREAKENLQERFLKQFDPTKNDSLFGWLTGVSGGAGKSQIYRAKGDVMKAYKESGRAETTSLDAMLDEDTGKTFADVTADTGAAEGGINMQEAEGLTIFLQSINASPKLVKAVNNAVIEAGVDLQGLTYKDVKKLVVGKNAPLKGVMNLIAEEFGIPASKIIENKDLNSAQRAAGQQFILDNADALLEMLPEGQTQSGQATGVANTKLGKLYEKGARLKMAEGATAAGKFAQNKRTDVTREEFLGLFGINPDGTFDNNRKHDGAIRAMAVQAGMITANQTMRQQAIENETNPISMIALLGEGRGAMMFSKQGKAAFGQIGKLIRNKIDAGIFLGLSQDLANNVLSELSTIEEGGDMDAKEKYAKEAIKGSVVATYGDLFTGDQINSIVNAIYGIATSNKLPKTDKGKVTRSEFIQREINKLVLDNETKVALYFGTNTSTLDLYNDPNRVKKHRGHAMAFHKKEIERINKEAKNEQEAGIAILESALMLRQQMSTAGVVGGKRAQLFTGIEFLEEIRKNTPGLEFSIKETVNKNNKKSYSIDYGKPITYKGQSLDVTQADMELDTQSGPAVINQVVDDHFDGTNKVEAREAGVKKAREHLNRYVEFHTGLYNNGITDASDLQMVAANLLSNMNPSLARAAMPKYVSEDLLPPGWKNMSKKDVKAWTKKNNVGALKPVYEHMQPRVNVVLDLFHTHLFEGGVTDVDAQFANYDVAVISDRMDKGLKTAKLNNSLAQGQDINDPSWMRYFNNATMETGEMVNLIGIGNNVDVNAGDAHNRVAAMLSAKQSAIKEAALANGLLFSKGARQGRQGITVLDFDDTLATTKSQIIVNAPDGSQFKLNAEEFAKRGADLLAEGNVFDFSEFNQVVGGKTAPLFNKALKLAGKFGTKNMFILTARPSESQGAIKQFLDSQGLNIPIENITGLGNSTAQAKAEWIAGKIGEGYNDFYFADDAIQNVEAVQDMLDQHDVKSKVQQAKLNFSRRGPQKLSDIIDQGAADLDSDFDIILEETKGVGRRKKFSRAKARKRGKGKGRFKFFLPPSAEDLKGLIYPFLGKGKVGEQHHAWFKEHLFDPFSKGIRHLNRVKQSIANDIKNLKNTLPEVKSKLRSTIPDMEFTYQDAIRVYNWNKQGFEIPGLSQADLNALISIVKSDQSLMAYADGVNSIMEQSASGMIAPDNSWMAGTIDSDITDSMKEARQTYLKEWQENADIIFSETNLNKIEAVFGKNHREALEDMLYRMKTGSTRNQGSNRLLNNFMNWVHGSIGATMFFNARSALLQQLSTLNFINWHDNNPLKAAAAFANQKQFWTDVAMIFNSPWLKQRRGGIGTDLNAAELLKEIEGSKNPMKTAIAYLLKIGFTPTQIGDSIAIATGGATMYRNRVSSYLNKGMTQAEAESQAFLDLQEISEETQQSTREDKISQQQASPLGKLILAFQNTPMQYNRLMKRAMQDLVNNRGDSKEHLSKIVYYGAAQSLVFYGLQQGLFAALFGDDEEDQIDEKEKSRLLNGMLDSILRGAGIGGAVVSTAKNTILEFMEQEEKADDDKFYTEPDHAYTLLEALNLSPPIGIKARKMYSALQTWEFNRDVIKHMDKTDLDNPMYDALFNMTEAVTNLPLHRLYNKYQNIQEALNSDNEMWQRIAMFTGWSRYNFGIKNQDVITSREEIKEIKATEKEERKEQKEREREIEKAEEERQIIEDNQLDQDEKREEGATEVQCAAVSRSGKRCSNMALPGKNFCTIHESVPQQSDEVQCSHVKKDGKRCKMKTKNKSGKCYYHD